MKKWSALLLVLVLCVGLGACRITEENGESTGATEGTNLESTGADTTTETDSTEADSTESSEVPTDATEEPAEAPVTGGDGEITYILNTKNKKIHKPDCRYADKISEENRKETTLSKEELEAMGYEACKVCKP